MSGPRISHVVPDKNSIEREIDEVSCYNNITTTWTELLDFSSFILKSRFNNDHNLRLAYLLIHGQRISLSNASRVLKISRTLFYNQILPENPAFLSKRRTIKKWAAGGSERIIILSDEANKHIGLIEALGLLHLGVNECQRLKIEATKARRGILKEQEHAEKKLKMSLETLRCIRMEKPYDYEDKLRIHAKMRDLEVDELDGMVNEQK